MLSSISSSLLTFSGLATDCGANGFAVIKTNKYYKKLERTALFLTFEFVIEILIIELIVVFDHCCLR